MSLSPPSSSWSTTDTSAFLTFVRRMRRRTIATDLSDGDHDGDGKAEMLLLLPLLSTAVLRIARAGMVVLVLVLLQATLLQGLPLSQLGRRPAGRGLYEWTFNYLFGRRRRGGSGGAGAGAGAVLGYDNIQGALSPPLRCAVHLSVFLFAWAVMILFPALLDQGEIPVTTVEETNTILIMSFVMTCIAYYMISDFVHNQLSPVSMPGGPRPHKIQRQPQWNTNETFEFTGRNMTGGSSAVGESGGAAAAAFQWQYQQAAESHETTLQRFLKTRSSSSSSFSKEQQQQQNLLTGEAVGRDIWTTIPQTIAPSTEQVDVAVDAENIVALLAMTSPTKTAAAAATATATATPTTASNIASTTTTRNNGVEQVGIVIVDENLVALLASGTGNAADFGKFTPSINPNSKDHVFRAQQIRNFLQKNHGRLLSPVMTMPAAKQHEEAKANTKKNKSLAECIETAVYFYSMLQTDDGHWSGDYGGPMFLMPGLICAWYVMGRPATMLSIHEMDAMVHYLVVHQQTDGGWGTHIESPSTMFGTVLNYVALRLLGKSATDDVCVRGRNFIRAQGGALYTSSWCKFYLCLLGCMEWDGHNSVPPELWLLPNWCPFHPGRMWCHARMVYLPMGYLYGIRYVYAQAESDATIQSLRHELYLETESYYDIDWNTTRHFIAPMDNYSPIPWTMKVLQNMLAAYERWTMFQPFKNWIRRLGIDFCAQYMAAEDLQTNFINIGPVNKVLNMLSAYHLADSNLQNENVMRHMARVADYLWLAEDGLKMKGYNGSQCWDTSFAIQAIYETGLLSSKTTTATTTTIAAENDHDGSNSPATSHARELYQKVAQRVWSYMERTQILSTDVSQATAAYKYESAEYRGKFYRHVSQGGWPFSTSAHGWPISDCTGEGLKAVLSLQHHCPSIMQQLKNGSLLPISDDRLSQAVNVLLSYQNEDGGFATYENNRGFGWYESLNPSEVFGDIMIDYSYVECSMASLTALADFQKYYPKHERSNEIQHALSKGREFLKCLQRPDGSWYGSWACCFCYACWFGIEGLVACGEPTDSPCIINACQFLLKHQRPNGGWGEDFTACFDKAYPKDGMKAYGDEGSGVVNTAWALMALSMAKCDNVMAIQRGVQYLMKRQLPCGDWPQEGIAGVFNRACGITYTAYRNIFPIWALGRCRATYGAEALHVKKE